MNKKYIAPFDMFDGEVKKGDVYSHCSTSFFSPEKKHIYSLPKEIVETWEECVEFKKGDFVTIVSNDFIQYCWIIIFDHVHLNINYYYKVSHSKHAKELKFEGETRFINCLARTPRHSTQEEKDLLISKLKEQGKYYDVSSHSIKDINPKYIPFTFEDNNQFRNKWLKHNDGSLHLITYIGKSFIGIDRSTYTYEQMFNYFTFEDGSKFGKLIEL